MAGPPQGGPGAVVPGWYPDPWGAAPLRYHDGFGWTPHLGPAAGPAPPGEAERWLLPVGRTPLSIVAGYVALFSVLLVFAPVALVLGVCALVQLQHRPGALGRGRAVFAVVMGAVFTGVLVLAILSANHLT